MNLRLVALETREILVRPAGLAWLGAMAVVSAAAAAWSGTSPTTTYHPVTVVGLSVSVAGWLCLIGTSHLAACVGGEDHELGTLKEHHLAGRGRLTVLCERLLVVVLVALALPAGALGVATVVTAGQAVSRALAGSPESAAAGLPLRLVAAALLASLVSGITGYALASLLRSRLLGFVVWLGLAFAYASSVPTAANSEMLATVLRYVPYGPVFNALLGPDNYLDRNLVFTTTSTVVSVAGTFAVAILALIVWARRVRLA